MPRILRPLPALLLSGVLVLALCAAGSASPAAVRAFFPLDASTIALGPGDQPVRVFDPHRLVPGTRVLAGTPDSGRQAAEQRAWLTAGRVPQVPELAGSTMVRDALLDLHVLSSPYGVPVAGWAPAWRYVWPRDSALAAVALARTGHLDDAERVVDFLQRVQPGTGAFAARYCPDGSGVPDGRGAQTDSLGWALWALDQVTRQLPPAARPGFVRRHRPLLVRSETAALALVDNARSLPPPSQDYWETPVRRLTLSTAALLAAGLNASHDLWSVLGDEHRGRAAATAALRVRTAITAAFGPDGYPRTVGGSAASVDLGVSYLLPPFAPTVPSTASAGATGVQQVWQASAARMLRPAGGLAPGGSWRDDGVSWNTATSSFALTAAFVGDRQQAVHWLGWLDTHRTTAGSLPEKVLADGSPASVAPLAWPAAAVVIAADQLERQPG